MPYAGGGFGGQSWGKTSTLDRAAYYCYNNYIALMIPPSDATLGSNFDWNRVFAPASKRDPIQL
jgi:hypothetical protein